MQEKQILIWNINLNYKIFKNNNSKQNILILHWWWWTSNSFLKLWDILKNSWYNIIIPDLAWFGKTKIESVFTLDDYAKLIEDFSIKLELNDFILFWHSNWWAISIKIANRWLIKIKKIILNNSAWIRNNFKRVLKRKILKIIIYPFKKLFNTRSKIIYKIKTLFYKLIWSRDYIESKKNIFLLETYKNMISSDLQEEMKNIKLNCLIIFWEKDKYTPVKDWIIMNKNIQNSKLIILKNEKHSIHLTNPSLLGKTILENLN